MLNLRVELFGADHAEALADLAGRAYAAFGSEARPRDTPAFVAHMQGDENPAGRAWVAVAEQGGVCVGNVSAIPSRFRTRDGRTVTGYQIGYFTIDGSQQRKGIGARLLEELRAVLRAQADSFVYGYPNRRSFAVLDRLGFQQVCEVRTWIHAPAPFRSPTPGTIAPEAAAASLADLPGGEGGPLGFVRDAAYFRWRFCGPDAGERYHFVRDGDLLLALAHHRFKGLGFTILVDAFPDRLAGAYPEVLKAARAASGGPLYVTTNMKGPMGIRVPRSLDPRPVPLLVDPVDSAIDLVELAGVPLMTADWMGF
ncbi:MAG: hypothetical protein CL910_13490 [Deltaproteobacteria bacterium]|jgi:GNAT superfamily N-acetyltransferase|nr:hypothetical protein [Deltaproteobacteria bacterium]